MDRGDAAVELDVGRAPLGRPPRISRDDVIRVAESLPVEQVSVGAVASQLGVTRAAVYRYVENADELRRISTLASMSHLTFTSVGIDDWRGWLFAYATALREWRLLNSHVDIEFDLTAGALVQSGLVREIERGIGLLTAAGYEMDRAASAIHFVTGIVWSNTRDELMKLTAVDGHHPLEVVVDNDSIGPGLDGLRHALGPEGVFSAPSARFEREIGWAIAGISSELHPS
jgi:TetR/AcrR family transcriptional regulator, tetracycline repressor protein